jgi:DNA-binding CsgD family transcriptional regulator
MEDVQARLEKLRLLTHRELEVLKLRGQEKSISEIAESLVIEERTVKFHLRNIYEKLELTDLRSPLTRLLEIQRFCRVLGYLSDTVAVSPELEPESEPEETLPNPLVLVLEDEVETIKQVTAIQPQVVSVSEQFSPPFQRRNIRNALLLIFVAAVLGGFIGGGITALLFRSRTNIPTIAMSPVSNTSDQTTIETKPLAPTESLVISPTVTNSALIKRVSLCGETDTAQYSVNPTFLRHQGVSVFNVENTDGAVMSNFIRTLKIDQRGVWIGYFATEANHPGGIGLYTKQEWIHCNHPVGVINYNINGIEIDHTGKIWIATEQSGVSVYDGIEWRTYTTQDGLPNNITFGLKIDNNGIIWVATLEGVASFDGKTWKAPYSASNNTLFHNKVHAIAFDLSGNIWVGHINDGVSQYDNASGKWVYHSTTTSGLGGNEIRAILVLPADARSPESIWFATADGGISKFEQGLWTVFRIENGLPSDSVTALAIDKYARIWAATSAGVAYFDGSRWVLYNTLNTLSIAFGPPCQDCPYNDEHVWTGTKEAGLSHSRLPYLDHETAIRITEVCFQLIVTRERTCPALFELKDPHVITATYSRPLTPGEKLRFEVTVAPRVPHQLREDRGDFLSNADENDSNLLGAHSLIPVKGTVDPGQPFTFTAYDNPLVAPQLADGEHEQVFTSTWRVWMHTRYVGPTIRIVFIVRKPEGLQLN